jgi:hypothetical protein
VDVFIRLYIGLLSDAYAIQFCFSLPNSEGWRINIAGRYVHALETGEDVEMKDIKNERKIEEGTTRNIENEKIEYTHTREMREY